LPLIALQYHEVKVNITFSDSDSVIVNGTIGNNNINAKLWADYIYLDTDERRRFAQVSHEYLIEQLQFTGDESVPAAFANTKQITLNYNHPVKELVWVYRDAANTQPSNYGRTGGTNVLLGNDNFAGTGSNTLNPFSLAKLQLNGHDRFAERVGNYFSQVQPYQHHTCVPAGPICVYSFALKPEDHQPSGTCNFSRIDNAKLVLTFAAAAGGNGGNIKVFATNYNVLRIMSGMGGLAYSN